MSTLTIAEAQARLPELIRQIAVSEPVIITEADRPVAQLVAVTSNENRPIPGRCKGKLTIVSDDDEHLKDWAEYLP